MKSYLYIAYSRLQRTHRRGDVCTAYRKNPSINKIRRCFSKLPPTACSGDEFDPVSKKYLITTLPWRAGCIRPIAQALDDLHISMRFPDNQNPTQGAFPIPRIDPSTLEPPRVIIDRYRKSAPPGLPRNFYDSEYLKTLSPSKLSKLKIKPAIDLSFDQHILEYVLLP